MKKMLFVFTICAICASTFAATEFPGWKCTDLQKLEAAKQGYIAEKDVYKILNVEIITALAKTQPKSFADIESVVEKLQKPESWSEEGFNYWKKQIKKPVSLWRREFVQEAWKYSKSNPSDFDIFFIRYGNLNLSDEEIYNFMINYLNTYQRGTQIEYAVKTALDKSINIDRVKVKADLQKLNTIFSRKLLQDKAKWEPIVAEIRTVLETY